MSLGDDYRDESETAAWVSLGLHWLSSTDTSSTFVTDSSSHAAHLSSLSEWQLSVESVLLQKKEVNL